MLQRRLYLDFGGFGSILWVVVSDACSIEINNRVTCSHKLTWKRWPVLRGRDLKHLPVHHLGRLQDRLL